ncbi:hypothetical protein J1605_016438 [Eschrichtius robustus]|uniref:Uncharacterized protein n=1 Tax=Eschrichtius robustus TaxID=9764 RepID=A0AB34I6M8_ESCRO|nr:hypothetical protein J1605_016438 [Eschrichtius robustus]
MQGSTRRMGVMTDVHRRFLQLLMTHGVLEEWDVQRLQKHCYKVHDHFEPGLVYKHVAIQHHFLRLSSGPGLCARTDDTDKLLLRLGFRESDMESDTESDDSSMSPLDGSLGAQTHRWVARVSGEAVVLSAFQFSTPSCETPGTEYFLLHVQRMRLAAPAFLYGPPPTIYSQIPGLGLGVGTHLRRSRMLVGGGGAGYLASPWLRVEDGWGARVDAGRLEEAVSHSRGKVLRTQRGAAGNRTKVASVIFLMAPQACSCLAATFLTRAGNRVLNQVPRVQSVDISEDHSDENRQGLFIQSLL